MYTRMYHFSISIHEMWQKTNISVGGVIEIQTVAVALKFTVHVVQSFVKGHRKSGVISIKHSRDITHLQWNNVCFLPVNLLILTSI